MRSGLPKSCSPRLGKARDTQVGDRKPVNPAFGLALRPSHLRHGFHRRSRLPPRHGKWRSGGCGFPLSSGYAGFFLMILITAGLPLREETTNGGAFHHRRVIFIRGQHMIRCLLEGILIILNRDFGCSSPSITQSALKICGGSVRSLPGKHIEFRIGRLRPSFRECIRQDNRFHLPPAPAPAKYWLFPVPRGPGPARSITVSGAGS